MIRKIVTILEVGLIAYMVARVLSESRAHQQQLRRSIGEIWQVAARANGWCFAHNDALLNCREHGWEGCIR